jgi:hypothetical protein
VWPHIDGHALAQRLGEAQRHGRPERGRGGRGVEEGGGVANKCMSKAVAGRLIHCGTCS